jgi:hypothetical protein
MRYRQLGGSGLRVSVLTMGTMTFGGTGGFASVGSTGLEDARRQVPMGDGPNDADRLGPPDLALLGPHLAG